MEVEQRATSNENVVVQKLENLSLGKDTKYKETKETTAKTRDVLSDLSNNKAQLEKVVTPEMKRSFRASLRESPKVNSPGIDKKDEHDPQAVTDYIKPILEHLRSTECEHLPPTDFMFIQKEVTYETRAILVDWLIEVNDRYKLNRETLFLTINILDRYLSKENVSYKKVQLVGLASMMIACKYQEITCPRLSAYIRLCCEAYNEDQLKKMEFNILTKLNFNITITSVNTFTDRFHKVTRSDNGVQILSSFLMDLTLLHPEAYQFKPSEICASSIHLSQLLLRKKSWSNMSAHYTMYKADQLETCKNFLRKVLDMYINVGCENNGALKRKYSRKTKLEIFQKVETICKD